jgi:hypothetical protein
MKKSKAGTVAALMIFCVFAMSVLMVLMLGANVYQNINEASQEGHEERIALSYIWTKAKMNDKGEGLFLGDFQGVPALCFDETHDDRLFRTVIYHHGGWLRELFYEVGLFEPSLDAGERVMKIEALEFDEDDNGLIWVGTGLEWGSERIPLSKRTGFY